MNHINEPAVRCPVCGGPAKDVEFHVDTGTGAWKPVTIRACENSACDAYHPAALQDI